MAKSKSTCCVQVTHGNADGEDTTTLAAVPFSVAAGIVENALAASGEGPYVFRVPDEHVGALGAGEDVCVMVVIPRSQFLRAHIFTLPLDVP